MAEIDWLKALRPNAKRFLYNQRISSLAGSYKYNESGDFLSLRGKALLGSSIYALKIFYTIDERPDPSIFDAILSYKNSRGMIYDDVVNRKTFFKSSLKAILNADFNLFFNGNYKRAEHRQAVSALELFDRTPVDIALPAPASLNELQKFINRMDWSNPWHAASHLSHVLFFYRVMSSRSKLAANRAQRLKIVIQEKLLQMENPRTGGWYRNTEDTSLIINGAMKVITGMKAIECIQIKYPERLIDLCLSHIHNSQACDNFNIVYVLKYCSEVTSNTYRLDEIRDFAINRLEVYNTYYKALSGGFSFYQNKANNNYYGFNISDGCNEADIHGTVLFLWGASIIAQILGLQEEVGLKEFLA